MTKILGAVLGLALAVSVSPVFAADISNLSGQSCGDQTGTWHFVNNQTGGATAGELTAYFSSGTCGPVGASAVNKSSQHFYCTGFSGTLNGASTNLPGKLVLSDFTCQAKCDPKTDPKCEPPTDPK